VDNGIITPLGQFYHVCGAISSQKGKALRIEGYTIRQIVEKLGPVSRVGKPFTVAAVHKMVKG
jgi:hypothetical protein